MKTIPQNVSESVRRINPHLYAPGTIAHAATNSFLGQIEAENPRKPRAPKPLLNQTEARYCTILESQGLKVLKQAITLHLDPPFKRYTPDLAYVSNGLVLLEVKGSHRFREKGIAKAALAAKTYPEFRFELAEWTGSEWKVSVLSP